MNIKVLLMETVKYFNFDEKWNLLSKEIEEM